jgi:hypothetical protein
MGRVVMPALSLDYGVQRRPEPIPVKGRDTTASASGRQIRVS